jgi:asparagine synthase (glutamine-hydrolysing)
MCGFVAFLQDRPTIDIETARRALARIAHRGPDAAGEWREKEIILLHRRLSIIDLHTGQQPMQSHDGRYVVVFNGEIYNFPELRQQLEREGCRFQTHSDTEVILEGYRRWGNHVVNKLNGMFAFVVWDRKQQLAFGARDRLGIKPMCWAMQRGALIVSSTLEPFSEIPGFDHVNPVAIRHLLTFDNIHSPLTVIRGVNKLEPGCTFVWRIGDQEPSIERYWRPPLSDPDLSVPSEGELEALLDGAVKRQMISDVTIGVFLSGGIDSSLIAALMARNSEKPIRTFSIAFDDAAMDESRIAQLVARQYGTDHTVLRAEEVGPEELLELIGRLDEPFADAAVVPTYALSKMTASHVKVALSGDGGDEVFGGYPKYFLGNLIGPGIPFRSLFHYSLRAFPWKPRGMSHVYRRTLSSQERVRWSLTTYGDFPIFRKDMRQVLMPAHYQATEVDRFFEPWERRAKRYGERFDTDLLMRTDLETYLNENCLVKTDRASMLASLEVRVPFLDNQVLDRIVPLPADKKIVNGMLKALLLPLVKRILPREVWDRPKHGFSMPLDTWLAGNWRPAVESALHWGEANTDLFNFKYLWSVHRMNMKTGGIGRELWNPFVYLAWAMAHKVKL